MENLLLRLVPVALQPYAKFVMPAALGVIAAVIGAVFGVSDETAMRVALVGFAAASIAFVVENAPDGLARYAKAIAPAVLTVVTVLVSFVVSGEWNAAEWQTALAGLGAALVTVLVPNGLLPGEPEPLRPLAAVDGDPADLSDEGL